MATTEQKIIVIPEGKICDYIDQKFRIRESYDAILIEDDKDARFLNEETASIDLKSWEDFKESIQRQLQGPLTCDSIRIARDVS